MTDKDSAALGLESLRAFQDAKNDLLNSLSEVEETIARNLETKEAIVAALGEIGIPAPSEKKPAQRRGKKTEAAVVEPVEPPLDPEVPADEPPDEPVIEHLASGDTQDEVVAEAEAKGEDSSAALEDWEPGESANSESSKTYGELNFDEIQF